MAALSAPLALSLALQICVLYSTVFGACRVRFEIDPDGVFHLSGTNIIATPGSSAPPLQADIKEASSIIKSLAGALYGSSEMPACPGASQADWITALPSFTFTSAVPFEYSPISVWPPVLNATTAGFLYQPRNLELELNASITSVDAVAGTFQAQLVASVLKGWLLSYSPMSSTRWDTLVNSSVAVSSQPGVVLVQANATTSTLLLQIPEVFLNLTSTGSTIFVGTTDVRLTTTNLYLTGPLRMKAVLSCPSYCGDHGRCVVNAGATSGICQCECGWGLGQDGSCSEPRGRCDAFPDTSNISTVVEIYRPAPPTQCVVTAPQNALAGDTDTRPLVIPMDLKGNCQDGYTLNAAGTGCTRCSLGYTGLGCGSCQSDEGCQAAVGSRDAVCWRNATYGIRSAGKNYTCITVDESDRGLLGDSLSFTCSTQPPFNATKVQLVTATLGSNIPPVQAVISATPYCTMSFRMPSFLVGSYAVCSGWDCVYGRDSSRVSCSVVVCDCPDGCMTKSGDDMAPTFKGLTGSLTLTCDPPSSPGKSQDCRLGLSGMPIDVVRTKCQASECYDPNSPRELGIVADDTERKKKAASNLVIVMIPIAILAGLMVIASCLLAMVHPYVTSSVGSASSLPGHGPPGPDLHGLKMDMGRCHAALHFSFTNIDVYSQARTKCLVATGKFPGAKQILHGISGYASAGEVVAILGPSGSGKMQTGGAWKVTGDITLGKESLAASQLCHVTSCVPQHDLLLRYLTVEECLRSSAALRLGTSATPSIVWQRCEHVLQELNIAHLRHRRTFKGNQAMLSGGERQRVSIGVELVTDPKVLLLDEPTSGLDSYNALQVMQTIQLIAVTGRVVMTSLHQPSPVLYSMLNRVILIARGCVVFMGAPSSALSVFQDLGVPCPSTHFIAEHMLEVVGSPEQGEGLLAHVRSPAYKASLQEAVLHATLSRGLESSPTAQSELEHSLGQQEQPSSMRRVGVLLWRTMAAVARNPILAAMHIIFAIILGLTTGFVYYRLDLSTAGAQNRVGSLFFILNAIAFLAITSIDALQSERLVCEREMVRRFYHPTLYLAQKMLVDSSVLRVMPAVIFGTTFYWLAKMRPDASAFLVFIFTFSVWHCVASYIGFICGSLISTPGKSSLVFAICQLLMVLFSGFLVNKDSMHWAIRWLCYVNPMRHAWEALAINELKPLTLTFNAPGLPPVPPLKGELFLGILGVNSDNLLQDIVILNCTAGLLAVLGLVAMWARVKLLQKGYTEA